MAEESAVKVCVRIRPLIEREEVATTDISEPIQLYWKAEKKSIQQIDDGNPTKSFSFDRVFSADETTNQLYQGIAKPLVVSTVEGYNGTIFAYGQTSSGKTFTMMGNDLIPGVIPLAMEDVFQSIKSFPKKEFLLRVSYMEIYNETVTDLLVDSWKRKPLEIRETIGKNVFVADLTEELVTSPSQALAWIRKGEKNRHYGKTKMNQRSSRSHTIFRMILESRERSDPASGENADGAIIVSHLNLVDLAGSERASQTGAEGTRFKEGCNINRSLFILGQVIKKLSDESQRGFTNYRDSKLTRILQNSLGGNAKTVIIATITPATIDETLTTLQFASTAKKMKNDPHVTEVSDDGALLKRYRNEIVDLKRRLHEVSSVTQTTVTEKETLSQILQEKDQLQREQQDRIRNLTKLLVTSSNLFPVKKLPKRRVTWGGGKLLRLAQTSGEDADNTDLSFAESVPRKRKADQSALTELGEDDEDFDSRWEIPDESTFDMDITHPSNVNIRSFGESPKEFVSPHCMHEWSDKVSSLELQLETETRQKEESMARLGTLNERVVELGRQLETEAQQRQEAVEKAAALELRVTDLEKMLEVQAQADEQMRTEFAETIRLYENLVSEKDLVVTERDYFKQELGIFMEEIKSLEKGKSALAQELEEQKSLDEFKLLEEDFMKEHEKELQKEITTLKKALESSEQKCREFDGKLGAMSEELKKKSDWAEELQSLGEKDLVEQVSQLRRSLDDAEGLSRDTKKEWAVLRSQNIALKERDVELTARYDKIEAEVNGLRCQLEAEKSRYRKMQADLQKELNVAFDENTKLTTLLDGKVPKNLIDSVDLERKVGNLNKELAASRESEEALRVQLHELDSLQALPDKVNDLMKQVCELTKELCGVQTHRDSLLSAQAHSQDEAQQLRDSLQAELSAAQLQEQDLTQRCADMTKQVDALRSDLEDSRKERNQLLATAEQANSRLDESDSQRTALEQKLHEMQPVIKDLEERLADSEQSRSTEEEIGKELQEQLNQLTEELDRVQAEQERLLSEKASSSSSSTEDMEKLLSTVTSLTEERDQLKLDMQENVEMMIENQEDLRTALETIQEQKQKIRHLEASQMSNQDSPTMEKLEELQNHVKNLSEELESVQAEREHLLSEQVASPQSSTEDLEKLMSRVTSLSEERDQLQEILEGLRVENHQLKSDLEEKMEMMKRQQHGSLQTLAEQKTPLEGDLRCSMETATDTQVLLKSLQEELEKQYQKNSDLERQSLEKESHLERQVKNLSEELESVQAERERLLSELMASPQSPQSSTEDLGKLMSRVTSLSEERDQLQEILEGLRVEKNQLKADLEEKMEMIQTELQQQHQQALNEEQESQRLLQIKQLEEQLESLTEERHQLKIDLEENVEMMIQNQDELREAQGNVETLKEEIHLLKFQKAELEKITRKEPGSESDLLDLQKQVEQLTVELDNVQAERERLQSENKDSAHSSTEEFENLVFQVTSLTEERDQLQEMLEGLRQEKNQINLNLEAKQEMVEQLHSTVQTMTEQKSQLESDLQHHMEMAATTQDLLHSIQKELSEQKQVNSNLEKQSQDKESLLEQEVKMLKCIQAERDHLIAEKASNFASSTEEREKLISTVMSLTKERDQLQDTLERLRQEKNHLNADLKVKEEMISAVEQKLTEQQNFNLEQKAAREQEEALLQQEIQQLKTEQTDIGEERSRLQQDLQENMEKEKQLEQELQTLRDGQLAAKAEVEASSQRLNEANTTISVLQGQLCSLDQSSTHVDKAAAVGLWPKIHDSTLQLQESFNRFKVFVDSCTKALSPLETALRVQNSIMHGLPQTCLKSNAVSKLSVQTTTHKKMYLLTVYGSYYEERFELLVKSDLAVFEERRLQDVLLCRAEAPSFSLKEEDLQALWQNRQSELLEKREHYIQKMASLLERLLENKASYLSDLSDELRAVEKFIERLEAVCTNQPLDTSALDNILSCELSRRSTLMCANKMSLEALIDENGDVSCELEMLSEQAQALLNGERIKSSTLLQGLEGGPIDTDLLDNQQLVLQLQQAEEEVKAMRVQIEQLEASQRKARERVSNHKQATQLLQTELQDACAQVEEKENVIYTLKTKLRESEAFAQKNASPSALELDQLRAQVVKMEVELTSASAQHQEEIKKMATLLNVKEESLRKLKETLRKSQQQGEESFLQGEDLFAKLMNPKGCMVQSSVIVEKTKLEEEVKLLSLQITELESLVSSQQADIAKWKSRAIKLKEKSRAMLDKPPSPYIKKHLQMTSGSSQFLSPKRLRGTNEALDSPKKVVESPKKMAASPKKVLESSKLSLLESPKSRFFDVGPGSKSLSRNGPKQFFDNSNLGTIPEVCFVPTMTDDDCRSAEEDAAPSVENREEWWPLSPEKAEMCKNQ